MHITSSHWLCCLQAAKAEAVEQMEELLQEAGMKDILALPKARVPVIKFVVGATGTKVCHPGLCVDPSACRCMQWHCNAFCGNASCAGLGTRPSQLDLLELRCLAAFTACTTGHCTVLGPEQDLSLWHSACRSMSLSTTFWPSKTHNC